MALKANAGFVRFTPPAADPVTGVVPTVVFQVGIRSPDAPTSISGALPTPFTAFECAAPDGSIEYDTVVYISNRSDGEIHVDYKITNAENGQPAADSFVMIGPFKMLAFSLAGALK